ncbi:hypothetical protein [Aliiglaciecola aliphaticivorans]
MTPIQLRSILLILIVTIYAIPHNALSNTMSDMTSSAKSANQSVNLPDSSVFAKGIRGFWVTRIQADENSQQNIIINFNSLKIPPTPNNPPFLRSAKFGTVSAVVNGKTCTFEVVTALEDKIQMSFSVSLSPFYRVNKKGKIRNEKQLERCRALGLNTIDFYAIKPKLLGGSIHFENGNSVNALFKPQGGARLKLNGQTIIAENAKRFDVTPPAPATKKSKQHEVAKGAPTQTLEPPHNAPPAKPLGNAGKQWATADHAFTLKNLNYKTFHLPVYEGIPALVSNGLLSTGTKAAPSYQPNYTPSNVPDWQGRFRALRDFLDIASFIDKNELVKWYKTTPKGENGGAPSYDVALAKRRADWMLERVKKAFLSSAEVAHIHKYFCPDINMKSVDFSLSRCSVFNGNPFEQRRLLRTFLDEAIPELMQYAEPLKHITRVAVLNWSLMSEYSFDDKGFLVQLFTDYGFYPYGEIVTTSPSDYSRKFKEKYAVFETMYIGPKMGLSGRGSHGAYVPMDEDEAETLINKAQINNKRYASFMTIELIPEDHEAYKQRILTEKKLTAREYQYELVSSHVVLFLATQEGMLPLHTFPADVKPIK